MLDAAAISVHIDECIVTAITITESHPSLEYFVFTPQVGFGVVTTQTPLCGYTETWTSTIDAGPFVVDAAA